MEFSLITHVTQGTGAQASPLAMSAKSVPIAFNLYRTRAVFRVAATLMRTSAWRAPIVKIGVAAKVASGDGFSHGWHIYSIGRVGG